MLLPFGGLRITGGADTLALSSTAGKFVSWAASGGANSPNANAIHGDPAIVPDKANSRIKVNSPGIYFVQFTLSGDSDGAQDIIAKLRKNGSVYGEGLIGKAHITTDLWQVTFSGFVQVTESDNPDTLATFADPDQTAGVGKPAGSFGGLSGAPKTLSYLEIYLESAASTPTITALEANFSVLRVG